MTGRASILPELMPGHARAEGAMPGDLRARQITSAAGAHTTQATLCISNALASKIVEHDPHADRDLGSNKPACLFPLD